MKKIIFDTSFVVGFIDEKDVWHSRASLIEDKLSEMPCHFIVFDCVINEAVNVLSRRQKERKSDWRFSGLLDRLFLYVPKENITWIYPEAEKHFDKVIALVKKSNGALNFHDALIVHVSNELEISHIVSFDADFDKTKLRRIKDAGDI